MIDHETLFPPERPGAKGTIPITDQTFAEAAAGLGFEMIPVECDYCGDSWCHVPDGDEPNPACKLCGIGHGVQLEL